MPLVEGNNNVYDSELNRELSEYFTIDDGQIYDRSGFPWTIWRLDAIEAWWMFFEETIGLPMGRKLANAACDEEEFLTMTGELLKKGLFKERKMRNSIVKRWRLHGWGQPIFTPYGAEDSLYVPISAGILQADIERIKSKRYRMRWEEKGSGSFRMILDHSDLPVQPSKQALENRIPKNGDFSFEIESGWKIDGQRSCLLPLGLFTRLVKFSEGIICAIDADERNSWIGLSEGALAMAISSKKLFIAGEEVFLAIDSEGWLESANELLRKRGIGAISKLSIIDEHGGISVEFKERPSPFEIGLIAGAWTRCEGRPVKVNWTENVAVYSSRHNLA